MKKLLLGTAAVALGLSLAAPAMADGVKLDVSGHFKGYAVWNDQDDNLASDQDARDIDILRETEIHFSGETTLDNGLTVGVHVETDIDGDDSVNASGDQFATEEAYVYFSGAWGRVNFGKEDGAAYLLQVAAPSADSNVDGLRQFVQPVNYNSLTNGALTGPTELGYDQAISDFDNKLTYITPVFSGFQAGVSYTPESDSNNSNALGGVNLDDDDQGFGDIFDVAVRYEGQFDEVGVIAGFGYTHANLEEEGTIGAGDANDDRTAWNAGLDLDWGPFGIGVSYSEDDNGDIETTSGAEVDDEEIIVVGVDYTTGPFKLGASYFTADNQFGVNELETERYSAGVVYTYGPGLTFRGSVHYIEHDNLDDADGAGQAFEDADATSILLGTQINF